MIGKIFCQAASVLIVGAILLSSSEQVSADEAQFAELKDQWEGRSDGNAEIVDLQTVSPPSGQDNNLIATSPAKKKTDIYDLFKPRLTITLVSWISSQSEVILEEMEAIAKFNAESSKFSVVSYLRYLTLFDHLKVVTSKRLDEFKWISKKANAFARIYQSATEIVNNYLEDIDNALRKVEDNEPKSKQVDPSNEWMNLYGTIRYIALHAPLRSELAAKAKTMLASSPDNTLDRARCIRYHLKTRAFS